MKTLTKIYFTLAAADLLMVLAPVVISIALAPRFDAPGNIMELTCKAGLLLWVPVFTLGFVVMARDL